MSYVVFSLAKCHLCDGDYDYEYDAEVVQELKPVSSHYAQLYTQLYAYKLRKFNNNKLL